MNRTVAITSLGLAGDMPAPREEDRFVAVGSYIGAAPRQAGVVDEGERLVRLGSALVVVDPELAALFRFLRAPRTHRDLEEEYKTATQASSRLSELLEAGLVIEIPAQDDDDRWAKVMKLRAIPWLETGATESSGIEGHFDIGSLLLDGETAATLRPVAFSIWAAIDGARPLTVILEDLVAGGLSRELVEQHTPATLRILLATALVRLDAVVA